MCFLLLHWSYVLIVGMFGFKKPKYVREFKPEKKFLILAPAHNEENVIGSLVQNLKELDYPKELYEVVVIADNCSDRTAEISLSYGAMVLEHFYKLGEPKGKPYAIKYALEQLDINSYDAIVFFDADNLVSQNFLKKMNNHFMRGDKLVQAYLDSKNPTDNMITLSYATAYYYMNRSWQVARSNLGLPAAIGGTGFAVSTKVLKEIGWNANSLTEDLEFQMECLTRGIRGKWCHDAKIYDEKPLELKASIIQRLRWARGHWQVCFKFVIPLLKRFFTKRDIGAFDGAIYLLNPSKITLSMLTFAFFSTQLILKITNATLDWYPIIAQYYVWLGLLLFQFYYIIWSMKKDANVSNINKPKAIFSLIFFNVIYMPLFFWALITKGNTTWRRTQHTRSISFNQLNFSEVAASKDEGV